VLVAAHGNSLRALVKHLDNISDAAIVNENIPTGIPLVYELDDQLKPRKHITSATPKKSRSASPRCGARQGQSLRRLLLPALAFAALAAQGAPREEDLQALRSRIDSLQQELEGKESEKREARDALRDSERAISNANRTLAALEAEGQRLRAEATQLAERRRALERTLAERRPRSSACSPPVTPARPDALRVALSGDDPSALSRRWHYLGYVSRAAPP